MKITAKQLRKLTLTKDQTVDIVKAESDRFDFDTTLDTALQAMEAFPIPSGQKEQMSRLDRVIYLVRGAYLVGYMRAVVTVNGGVKARIDELIAEDK